MRNDPDFNITFVGVVQKYPELYNFNLDKSSTKLSRERYWKKVAKQVEGTALECKNRWRMLRVSFLRSLREKRKFPKRSGRKRTKHYLEDEMQFLIPFSKPRLPYLSHSESINESVKLEDSEDEDSLDDSDYNQEENQNGQQAEIITIHLPQNSQKKAETQDPSIALVSNNDSSQVFQKKTQSSSESVEHAVVPCLSDLKNNRKRSQAADEEDGDLLFLRSLLPDIKRLNDVQKRRFKQGIFVLYDEILNEETLFVSTNSSMMNEELEYI